MKSLEKFEGFGVSRTGCLGKVQDAPSTVGAW